MIKKVQIKKHLQNFLAEMETVVEGAKNIETVQKTEAYKKAQSDGLTIAWWRGALIALMVAVAAFVVWDSPDMGYLTIQVLMLFSVLFFGYRFGAGTGAIAGAVNGIILVFVSEQPAQIGILCLLGIFSGTFRSLGKMASVTAYATAAFGTGILYSPQLLFSMMQCVLAGGAVFLLLPDKLTSRHQITVDAKDELEWQKLNEKEQNISCLQQLTQLTQIFLQLAQMYREEEIQQEAKEPDWHMRYLELRQLLSEQMCECAQMLEETSGQIKKTDEFSEKTKNMLSRQLEKAGVVMKGVYTTVSPDGKKELLMALQAKSQRCISMKLVCERIEAALGKKVVLCMNQPHIVSSALRWVRFEEEAPYFVLYGAAGSCKSENDVSGDSFSCMTLKSKKTMLLLCDGMGSGRIAGKESARVTELAELMCEAGYMPSIVIRVINSALMIQAKEHPVAVDITAIDHVNGICEITKSGAAVTLLKRGGQVSQIGADSMPAGILREYAPVEKIFKLQEGDILIMVSDGVLEELPYIDKEEAMCRFCTELEEDNPREIAAKVLNYAGRNEKRRDDMTVLVAGIWKR